MTQRELAARHIMANPGRYKICLQCDSIIKGKVALCPNCHGYRFETHPMRVRQHAAELAVADTRQVFEDDDD